MIKLMVLGVLSSEIDLAFHLFVYICKYRCMHSIQCMCGGHRLTLGNRFPSAIVWVPGIKLTLANLVTSSSMC